MSISCVIDIELTNRCNAKCHFCPRDQTPHQGLMTDEVFDKSLERAIEYSALAAPVLQADAKVSLCGLGEPLLHRNAAKWVERVRSSGLECVMSSNGSLLTEERGEALLEAGLQEIFINVGDRDDDYEDVYQLPFERTRENVARFAEMSDGRCRVSIVLVDYRRDAKHLAAMEAYWRDQGISDFVSYGIMNRGGALFVDHMQFETLPQMKKARELLFSKGGQPICGAPFGYLFIGYDGNYYLCCSDWKKEVPFGSVFDASFADITEAKLRHVATRGEVCRTCNLDPLNQIADELRATDAGEHVLLDVEKHSTRIVEQSAWLKDTMDQIVPGSAKVVDDSYGQPAAGKRLIPLIAE